MNTLHFSRQGQGPTVVLSHALGCNLGMWDAVAAALQDQFTVLRYDQRGHGQSGCPAPPFSIDDMADDAARLIAEAAGEAVHFVGLSMGGMVAQSLAARHPQWVQSIVIANSASHYDDAARAQWQLRIQTVLEQGLGAIADGALARWFTPAFMGDTVQGGAQQVGRMKAELEALDPRAYAACCDAVAHIDFRTSNAGVRCPALVIAGTLDLATPLAMSEAIQAQIPGAELRTIEAAHLSAVEQPRAFADLLRTFLQAHAG
jgi:3-oxoadipate enol-lactonase